MREPGVLQLSDVTDLDKLQEFWNSFAALVY